METLHIELDINVEKAVIRNQEDPWIEFLDNIDQYAVDTGIEDFSINHEYYLYGSPKRQ